MRNTRVLFAASLFAGAGAALAAGCGSSSKGGGTTPGTGSDASSGDAAEEAGPSGGPGAGCGFISVGNSVMSCDPGMNLSCCINIATAFSNYEASEALGTCQTGCTESISYQCLAPSNCGTSPSQECCGTEMGDASAALAAFSEAGTDAAIPADASLPDGAATEIANALGGISFTSTCQSACTKTQTQLCASTTDCTANPGYVCAAPPASLFGVAAGGGGTGGLSASALAGFISIMICQPPSVDGGTTDGGTTDAGTTETDGGGATDAGSDAGATVTDGATNG